MVAVTMNVHGKGPVSELASALTDLDLVDAVAPLHPAAGLLGSVRSPEHGHHATVVAPHHVRRHRFGRQAHGATVGTPDAAVKRFRGWATRCGA